MAAALLVSRECRSVMTTATTIVLIATINAALIAGDRIAAPANTLTPTQGNPNTAYEGRVDRNGDPLPPGAVARLGTIRFRAPGEAQGLAFAPDGKTVAVNSHAGLYLIDAGSGKRVRRLGDFAYMYRADNAVVFSPDSKRLAARGPVTYSKGQSRTVVRVWDLGGDEKPREYDAEGLIWIGWSAQGEPMAASLDKGGVRLRELQSGKSRPFECPNLGRPEHLICACAPEALLVVPDTQNVIHVWDIATGKKRYTLEPDQDRSLYGLAVSADGRHLATPKRTQAVPHSFAVAILDGATGRVVHTVATDQQYLNALAFSRDGKTLATAGADGIRFWDVAGGHELSRNRDEARNTSMIAFSGDGKSLATLVRYSGMIQVWEVTTGKVQSKQVGHTSSPSGTAFSPDGRRVASGGGMHGTIHLWDLASSKSLLSIRGPGGLRDVAWSRDGRWLYSTWTGDELWISDAAIGERKHVITLADPRRPDTSQSAISMHLSADGKTLVAWSYYYAKQGGGGPAADETLMTGWDPITRQQRFRRTLRGLVSSATMSDDARLLALPDHSGDREEMVAGRGPIRVEDLTTGEPLLTLPALDGQTWPFAFSPDSRLLAGYNYNFKRRKKGDPKSTAASVVVWEVATASEVLSLPFEGQPRGAFSSDGRLVAIADERSILIWDLAQGVARRRFQDFDGEVTWLAFTPDGRRLISGHTDTTLLVWEIPAPPVARQDKLEAKDLARAWAELAGGDAPRAFRARWTLVNAPEAAVTLLTRHLRPTQPADARRLAQLLGDLDSDQFPVRTAAQKELEVLGELAAPALRQALAKNPSLEVRRRAESLLDRLRGPVTEPEQRRTVRALAVLEAIATPEARKLLATLAQGVPESRQTQEARAAIDRLQLRDQSTLSRDHHD
jgi:WD40 repeat protein